MEALSSSAKEGTIRGTVSDALFHLKRTEMMLFLFFTDYNDTVFIYMAPFKSQDFKVLNKEQSKKI